MIDYTTDREWAALLKTIVANPADDLPRLVAADWLEEGGEHDRAEFIRVQCELAGTHGSCDKCGGNSTKYAGFTGRCRGLRCRLKRREYMVSRRWIVWEWTVGVGGYVSCLRPDGWHRGFVSEVRCTLAEWLGKPCESCGERGMFGGFDGDDDDDGDECLTCAGTGRIPGLGPQIVLEHPIERVSITDRTPFSYIPYRFDGPPNRPVWVWYCTSPFADDVPFTPLAALLPQELRWWKHGDYQSDPYATDELAHVALSDALIRWAKAKVKAKATTCPRCGGEGRYYDEEGYYERGWKRCPDCR